jgi:hypothetical protein
LENNSFQKGSILHIRFLHTIAAKRQSSTVLGHELATDLGLLFEFEIPENAVGSFE